MSEFTIIHQDERIAVIDKPSGMLVHHGNGTEGQPTVVDELRYLIDDSDTERPGIVHRLDRDTSGLLIVARDTDAKRFLQEQFKNRSIEKTYIAAASGRFRYPEAHLQWPIARHPVNPMKRAVRPGGKAAETYYRVTEEKSGHSLIDVKPLTGRTHQIRVHMQHLGHPVLGDRLYGAPEARLGRLFLHACHLRFRHPAGSMMELTSELPVELSEFWYNL